MAPPPPARLTMGIVAATVAVGLLVMLAGRDVDAMLEAGFIPARFGAEATDNALIPAWLTPLSSTFVHAGAIHLGFNMLMLFYCGRQVEQVLGWPRLAVLYLVGAYAAAAAQYLVDPGSPVPVVGASGAISAVVGTYAVFFSQSETRAIGPISAYWVRAIWLGAGWVGLQLLIGIAGMGAPGGQGIAIAAHIGGFIAGLLLAKPLLRWAYRNA